ncbi:MAG: carbohydrate ABC transporter permease [Candidatus Bipolaricaulia bacterium]
MKLEVSTFQKICIYTVLGALTLVWLFPIASSVITSIKSPSQFDGLAFWSPPKLKTIPGNIFSNVGWAWGKANLGSYFLNSFIYALAGGAGSAFLASLAGFSLVHLGIKAPQSWFMGIFSGNLFPFQMFLIPLYLFTSSLGLYDTRIGLAAVYIGICIPFALLVYRNYALTIPTEVIEAARIDGCSDFRIYWNIFLPLSKAAFVVVFIFQFTWTWNDILFGMVLTQDVRPIMTGLSKLSGYRAGVPEPVLISGAIIASIPTVIVLLGLQKYFVKGFTIQAGQ